MRKTIILAVILLALCAALFSCDGSRAENTLAPEQTSEIVNAASEPETTSLVLNETSEVINEPFPSTEEVTTSADVTAEAENATSNTLEETTSSVEAVKHSYGSWVSLIAPTCTYSGLESRICTVCGYEETCASPALEHDIIVHEEKPATCTEDGWEMYVTCSRCPYTTFETVSALGHTIVTTGAIPPLGTDFGASGVVCCSMCDFIKSESVLLLPTGFDNPENYLGFLGFGSLARLENWEGMQDFYREINSFAVSFYLDVTTNFAPNLLVAELNYAQFDLTTDDAMTVFRAYAFDHPLYYWLDGQVQSSNSHLNLYISLDYAYGESRAHQNKLICNKVEECLSGVQERLFTSDITSALHEAITSLNEPILGSYATTIRLLSYYCRVNPETVE